MPSDNAILEIHLKYAPHERAFTAVYEHCVIVAEIARQIIEAKSLPVDQDFARAAILLHDVGYYPLYDESGFVPKAQGIKHGVTGAAMLRKEGLPEAICRIAACHTGMGLTKEHIIATHLPLPHRDFVAQTPEEWLVMYADKFHSKAVFQEESFGDVRGWFNSAESYLAHTRRFGEANARLFSDLVEQYGVPNLVKLAKQYDEPIK